MNQIAEKFVKLTLKLGQYDPAVVDAYFGPEEWKPGELSDAEKSAYPEAGLLEEVHDLQKELAEVDSLLSDEYAIRRHFLEKQLIALEARIKIAGGHKYSFDEESALLYDAVAPKYGEEHYSEILQQLDKMLPGKGSVAARFETYRNRFIVPTALLDTLFTVAIDESRKRTLQYISLPENESFKVEYVSDKPWGGYNWYKGNSFSLIQVNTDLPFYIDRVIDIASHEGYPGHHVYNALLEENLLKGRNWVEFYIYPLFSPTSLIAEGTANYGIEVAFPGNERIEFEKENLFGLAGLDSSKADEYYEIMELVDQLNFARNDASRKYYDGEFSSEELKQWLIKYCLNTPERADKSVDFLNTYGSYVINYNYGKELCKNYIESAGGTEDNPEKRWQLFTQLISYPYTASMLEQ